MDLSPIISKLFGTAPLDNQYGAAQDRFTHTPIVYEKPHDSSWYAMWSGDTTPKQVLGPMAPATGYDANKPGVIQIQQPGFQNEFLHHEIVHAATVPDLDPKGKIYAQAQRLLPQEVKDEVPEMWKNFVGTPGFDATHEGVARFLTAQKYQDPKYTEQKLKLIGAFPEGTRRKLTRLLASPGNGSDFSPAGY